MIPRWWLVTVTLMAATAMTAFVTATHLVAPACIAPIGGGTTCGGALPTLDLLARVSAFGAVGGLLVLGAHDYEYGRLGGDEL